VLSAFGPQLNSSSSDWDFYDILFWRKYCPI
jgi:hypothetical protein